MTAETTRQQRLLKQLNASNFVDINTFAQELGASISTIRRDLCELEEKGLLRRTHGGAVRLDQVSRDSEANVREGINTEEKQRIGARAAELVVDGDTVMIDSGTTSRQVALRLAGNPSLTFVTNGIDVFSALVDGGARNVHIIGGEYIHINRSLGGPAAVEDVRRFNVDKAILSIMSLDLRRGFICTLNPQIAAVQRAMLEVARSAVVVADHGKIGKAAFSVIAPVDRLDRIVTDAGAKPLFANAPEKIRTKCLFA